MFKDLVFQINRVVLNPTVVPSVVGPGLTSLAL